MLSSNNYFIDQNKAQNTNTAVIIAVVVCTVVLIAIIIITAVTVVCIFKSRRSPPKTPENKPHIYENTRVAFTNRRVNQIPDYENSEINVYDIPDPEYREERPVPAVYETLNM